MAVSSGIFFALLPVFFISLAIRGSSGLTAAVPMVILALAGSSALIAGVCNAVAAYWAGPAETRAGYTTEKRKYKYLAQVDPRTDRVVRMPGEDFLDVDEFRRRIAIVRKLERRGEGVDDVVLDTTYHLAAPVIRDAAGTVLANGDSVVLLKDLKSKSSSLVVEAGTEVENIRLVLDRDDEKVVSVTLPGRARFVLKPEFVRKIK